MPIQISSLQTKYGNVTNPVCIIKGINTESETTVRLTIVCFLSAADIGVNRPIFFDSFVDTEANAATNYLNKDTWLQTVDNVTIVSEGNINYSSGTVI